MASFPTCRHRHRRNLRYPGQCDFGRKEIEEKENNEEEKKRNCQEALPTGFGWLTMARHDPVRVWRIHPRQGASSEVVLRQSGAEAESWCLTDGRIRSTGKMPPQSSRLAKSLSGRCQGGNRERGWEVEFPESTRSVRPPPVDLIEVSRLMNPRPLYRHHGWSYDSLAGSTHDGRAHLSLISVISGESSPGLQGRG